MDTKIKKSGMGKTANLNGESVSKNSPVIHFEGAADELASHLGLIKAMLPDAQTRQFIEEIQKKLIKLMAHVSDTSNGRYCFTNDETYALETETERLSLNCPKQSSFLLPGRSVTEAQIHIARTVARRAERMFFAVNEECSLCPNAAQYLNRLSDYLYVLSQQEPAEDHCVSSSSSSVS
ncbi:MAG: cob(I)yrinic acid a,c-diamide adenosyltransferase [Treponema sp.]|nr:cob(I)yrinic acid a,c-diamide adenosyltransferase [Treponema sp.]